MPGLLESCEAHFGTRDIYELLKLSKSASKEEVHKAYKQLSLLVHPDRVPEEEKLEATEKFKVLGKIHSILSDTEKRKVYDQTGCVGEDDDYELDEKDWSEYWRVLFKEVTLEDITNYEKVYKESEDEKQDLKNAYLKGKGDMDYIFDHVPFMTLAEEPRFRKMLEEMIANEDIPSYDAFVNESRKKQERRKRKFEKEAKEAEIAQKKILNKKKQNRKSQEEVEEMDIEGGALMAIMQKRKEREAQADNFFAHLENKYGNKKQTNKKTRSKK